MTRAATQAEQFDRAHDYRKHEWRPGDPLPANPTEEQIAAELDRIEREIRDSATKSQAACKEAMAIIEGMMSDLGIPMHKEPV